MRILKYFLIGLVVGTITVLGGRMLWVKFEQSRPVAENEESKLNLGNEEEHRDVNFNTQTTDFKFEQPTNSLPILVELAEGDVTKTPTDATMAAMVETGGEIAAGEPIKINEGGKLVLKIGSRFEVSSEDESSLNFLSSLPENVLIRQSAGEINYKNNSGVGAENSEGKKNLSVRTENYLVTLNEGEMTVNLNKEKGWLEISLWSGIGSVTWENLDYESQFQELVPGDLMRFDLSKLKVVAAS